MKVKEKNLSASKTLLHSAAFFGLFLAGDLVSSLLLDIIFQSIRLPEMWMYQIPRGIGCIGVTFFLFYIYTHRVLNLRMSDFRINFHIKALDAFLAFLLPAIVVFMFAVAGDFSMNQNLSAGVVTGIVLSALFRALKAGVLEEMLFRGYIMKLVESRWNLAAAMIAPSFLFSLAHIPSLESIGFLSIILVILSGTTVGVMFSLAAYRSKSICGSALIHGVWNFIMVTNIFQVLFEKRHPAIRFFQSHCQRKIPC